MKKIIMLFIAGSLCLAIMACGDNRNGFVDDSTFDESTTSNDVESTTPTENNTTNSNEDIIYCGDYFRVFSFESIGQMHQFIEVAEGDPSNYKNFEEGKWYFFPDEYLDVTVLYDLLGIHQDYAKIFATDLKNTKIPLVPSECKYEGFGASLTTYCTDSKYVDGEYITEFKSNVFDLIYRISDVRYRFIYRYGETEAFKDEGTPAFTNVKIGDTEADFYKFTDDSGFRCSFLLNGIRVDLFVYSDSDTAVSFVSNFDFVMLPNAIVDDTDSDASDDPVRNLPQEVQSIEVQYGTTAITVGMPTEEYKTQCPSVRMVHGRYFFHTSIEEQDVLVKCNSDIVTDIWILPKAEKPTNSDFCRLKRGMSLHEVIATVGSPNQLSVDPECSIFYTSKSKLFFRLSFDFDETTGECTIQNLYIYPYTEDEVEILGAE